MNCITPGFPVHHHLPELIQTYIHWVSNATQLTGQGKTIWTGLNIHWKDWHWSWSSNTLATWCEEPTHWKRPWCWERLRAWREGMTEDEMVTWHHQLNGHEFEQAPGVGDGQGSLVWCSPWGHKESGMTEWTALNPIFNISICASYLLLTNCSRDHPKPNDSKQHFLCSQVCFAARFSEWGQLISSPVIISWDVVKVGTRVIWRLAHAHVWQLELAFGWVIRWGRTLTCAQYVAWASS